MLKLIINSSIFIFLILVIISCRTRGEKISSVLEITNFEQFKDWGIAYREPMTYLFTYKDTLRFMIRKEDEIYLVLNTNRKNLGMRPLNELLDYEKAILKEELINIVYEYQFDGISYINDSLRSYYIMGQIQSKETYLYYERGEVTHEYEKNIYKPLNNWYIRITDNREKNSMK